MEIPNSKFGNSTLTTYKKTQTIKHTENYMEMHKESILKWMLTLNQTEKATVMVITDQKLIGYLKIMISKGDYEKKCYSYSNQFPHIYCRDVYRYKPKQFSLEQIQNSVRQILNNVLILKTGQITLKRSFLNKYQALLQHISIMTNNLMFTYLSLNQNNSFQNNNSVWFRNKQFHSICEWLIFAFENEIVRHYLKGNEVVLFQPIVHIYSIKSYLLSKVKENYFTIDKIRKHYVDKRILENQEGKKHKQLNIHRILELSHQKTDEQLTDDILFDRLRNYEDTSYLVYVEIIMKLVEMDYQNSKFDELLLIDENENTKETQKKKKNKNKKKNKKQKKSQQNPIDNAAINVDSQTKQQQINNEQKQLSQQEIISTKEIQQLQNKINFQKQQNHKEDKQTINQGQQQSKKQEEQIKKRKKRTNKKINTILSQFLRDFTDQFSYSSNKLFNLRKMVFNRLQTTIFKILQQQKIFIQSSLKLFGSCALGLSTEQSDIDMVLTLNTNQSIDQIVLQIIYSQLEKYKWVSERKLINSSIPLLKLEIDLLSDFHIQSHDYNITSQKQRKGVPKFEVDLSIETKISQNHQGVQTTQFALDLLKKYNILREITLLLKVIIKARGLNITFHGGINSYVLFLLIYGFLKNQNLLQSTQMYNPLNQLLVFYSQKFDLESTIIDLRLQKPIVSTAPVLEKLTIVDPLSQKQKMINTNSSQIEKIFDLFKQIHKILQESRILIQQAPKLQKDYLVSIYSMFKFKLDNLMQSVY